MEILVGLDVSVASTSVCALGADGKVVNEAKGPLDPESLVEHVRVSPGSVTDVGLEAGPLSQWLCKGQREAGLETVLTETKRVKSALKSISAGPDYCRSVRCYGRNSISPALPPAAQQQRERCRPQQVGSLRTSGLWPGTRHRLRDPAARNAISRSCMIPAMQLC